MKILVTGATGFIGRHVVPRLLISGNEVVAVARDEAQARQFDWFDAVDFLACDIYRLQEDAFLQCGQPDAAIHLAWPGLPNYKQLFHYEQNLFADYRFLKSLISGGLGQLLVTGTCLEYGMRNGCLREDMLTCPANPYALAKDTLRKFLESLGQSENFVLQWARLFYMYGPGQSQKSLFSQLDEAVGKGEKFFNMSGGEQLRDYLPVEQVAARLVKLLEHPSCQGVVNICRGEPISVRRMVEDYIAERNWDIGLNLGYHPYPDYEPMAFWGDIRKFSIIDN